MSGVLRQHFLGDPCYSTVQLLSANLDFEYYYNHTYSKLLISHPRFYFYVSKYSKKYYALEQEIKMHETIKKLKYDNDRKSKTKIYFLGKMLFFNYLKLFEKNIFINVNSF